MDVLVMVQLNVFHDCLDVERLYLHNRMGYCNSNLFPYSSDKFTYS